MNQTLRLAGIALLFFQCTNAKSQTFLNWSSAFSPGWAHGQTNRLASNVGGSSINCNISTSITGGGAFMPALGNSGAQTPTVSGATFLVPGASSSLQVTTNFTTNTSYCNIVLGFNSMATNVSLNIVDIDKSSMISDTYFDRVTITGTNGVSTFTPTITRHNTVDPDFLVISGNTAHVNTAWFEGGNSVSDLGDQRGTVVVSFGTATINSITIRYDNAPGADGNPAAQAIGIGEVSFVNSVLPVRLINFDGHRQSNAVKLNWTTSQEFNTDNFEIQRKTTGDWESISLVNAAGSTGSRTDYSFTDNSAPASIIYYRLKQNDIDLRFTYSNILRISAKDVSNEVLVYPNPFSNQVNISVHSPNEQSVNAFIYDLGGRIVRTEVRKLYPGNNNFTINGLQLLPKGIYSAEVKDINGNSLGNARLVKPE
jgi:hypothetical protein